MKNIKLFVLFFSILSFQFSIPCFADKPHSPGPITGNIVVCQSTTNTYSIDAVSGATSYTWIVPGSWNILSGQGSTSISIIAGAASGDVCVMASNDCGASNPPACLTVTVNPLPAAAGTITGTGTGTVCKLGTGYIYTVPVIANATGYTWSLPSGGVITANPNTNSITVSYTVTATSGVVSVYGSNSCGTYTASSVNVAIVGNAAAPNGLTALCKNPGTTSYITYAINATSYTWSVTPAAGSISGTSETGTVTWSPTYTGTAIVSVTPTGCNSLSASTNVTVTNTVSTPAAISGPTTPCYNPTSYTTSATNATSYNWSITPEAGTISGTGSTGTVTWASTYTGTATISVTANGCNGPSSARTTTVTISTPASLSIGASYLGGKIAYFLQPGDVGYSASVCHGIIAAVADQSTGVAFSSNTNTLVPTYAGCYPGCTGTCTACTTCNSSASGTAIGTGLCNTNAIMAQGATSGAAYICRNYTDGTYTDWYLPSLNEWGPLCTNQVAIGGFVASGTNYWSSTSTSATNATLVGICGTLSSGANPKTIACRVRCIRSF